MHGRRERASCGCLCSARPTHSNKRPEGGIGRDRRESAMRSLISCIVVLITPFAGLLAAPAPFPKDDRSQTWELTLAPPSEAAYDAHRSLRSSRLSWDLAEAEPVRLALPRLTETEDRQRWLRRRLSITVDKDGFSRVRVTA